MILIIGAMNEEVEALLEYVNDSETIDLGFIKYYVGKIHGENVAVALSGIGKVNAAFTTTYLSQALKPKLVINIGSAGGLQENQNIGDIVIASKIANHDIYIGDNSNIDLRFQVDIDNELIDIATKSLESLQIPYHIGLTVTGDQFVTLGSYALQNIQTYYPQAICSEMEAVAIAMVCYKLNIPSIILRGLSDITIKAGNEQTFEEYLVTASRKSALLTQEFIKNYIKK